MRVPHLMGLGFMWIWCTAISLLFSGMWFGSAQGSMLIGTGIGAGMLGRELLKLIPVYGWAVAGLYSGAMTYALGQAFCVYLNGIKRGALPTHDELKETYNQAFVHARQFLKNKEK